MNNYPDLLLRQITVILNDPATTTKVKRCLLRDHLKLSEKSVNELCPKDPETTLVTQHDYDPGAIREQLTRKPREESRNATEPCARRSRPVAGLDRRGRFLSSCDGSGRIIRGVP
jgi:hypothetical protein